MILTVWLTLASVGVVKVGELAVDDHDFRGALRGQFRYSPEYLEHPRKFSMRIGRVPESMAFLKIVSRTIGAGGSCSAATSCDAKTNVFPSYCGYWGTRGWEP